MPRMPDTKDRILDTGAELFRRQGYAATGLKQIVAEGGGPIGSLYHFFPGGKEQLGAEALARSGRRYGKLVKSVFERAETVADGMQAWFEMAADLLEHSGFADGCPVATVALEVANTNETLRQVCAEVFASWQVMVVERLVEDGYDVQEASAVASYALAALEGAFILGRTTQDAAQVRAIGAVLARTLRVLSAFAR